MEALPSQSATLAATTVGSPSAVWKVADLIPSVVTLAIGPAVWRKPAASPEAGDAYISYITGGAFEKTTVLDCLDLKLGYLSTVKTRWPTLNSVTKPSWFTALQSHWCDWEGGLCYNRKDISSSLKEEQRRGGGDAPDDNLTVSLGGRWQSAHWWALITTLSGTRTLILAPPSPAARKRKSGHRAGKKCAQGNTPRERGRDLTPEVLAVEPEVQITVGPPVPLLPPSGLPSMLGPDGHSPELSAGSGARRPSGPGSGAGSPARSLTLACLTIYNMHRSRVSGVIPRPFPTQNTLNRETRSKTLCGKIGRKKKSFNCTPFSKTRNKLPLRMLAILRLGYKW